MAFQIRILGAAERDLQEARDWHEQHSVSAALKFLSAFEEARNRIARGPLSYAVALRDRHRRAVHVFVFRINPRRPYAVYYFVIGDEVRVLRVRGPGQAEVRQNDLDAGSR